MGGSRDLITWKWNKLEFVPGWGRLQPFSSMDVLEMRLEVLLQNSCEVQGRAFKGTGLLRNLAQIDLYIRNCFSWFPSSCLLPSFCWRLLPLSLSAQHLFCSIEGGNRIKLGQLLLGLFGWLLDKTERSISQVHKAWPCLSLHFFVLF